MTVQATVGGAVLGTAVGAGAAPNAVSGPLYAQGVQTLSVTGASQTLLLSVVAMLFILAGFLLVGLARRHEGLLRDDLLPADVAFSP